MSDETRMTRHALSDCPSCGMRLDASTSLHGETPREGDYSVCFYCGAILTYDRDLGVSLASREQLLIEPPEVLRDLEECRHAVLSIKLQTRHATN